MDAIEYYNLVNPKHKQLERLPNGKVRYVNIFMRIRYVLWEYPVCKISYYCFKKPLQKIREKML